MKNFKLKLLLALLILPFCFAFTNNDSVEIGSTSDLLEIGESIGNVRETLTEVDLGYLLKGGQIITNKGSTEFNQYVRFPDNGDDGDLISGTTVFGPDKRREIGHYLYFADGDMIFQYEIEFEQGLESDINNGVLESLIDKKVFILGQEFTITEATLLDNKITLRFSNYKLEIIFEYDPAIGGWAGAEVIDLSQGYPDPEDINDAKVVIHFENISANEIRINYIRYELYNDAILGDAYIAPGTGLREQLDEPEGMLTPDWDITYEGLMETGCATIIHIDAIGTYKYKLGWSNQENTHGIYFGHPLLSNRDSEVGFVYGDKDDNLWFTEGMYEDETPVFNIGDNDYFVLSDCMVWPYNSINEYEANNVCSTHVLKYEGIDTIEKELTFIDMGTGGIDVYYNETTNQAELIFDEVTYLIQIDPNTENLAIDLNGDGVIASELNNNGYGKVLIGTKGEGIIDLGWQMCLDENNDLTRAFPMEAPTSAIAKGNKINYANISLITLTKEFDEANEDEILTAKIEAQPHNSIGITNITADSGLLYGLFQVSEEDDTWQGLSRYGVLIDFDDPIETYKIEDLIFEYPKSQRGSRVFVAYEQIALTNATINVPVNGSTLTQTSTLLTVTTDEEAVCEYSLEYWWGADGNPPVGGGGGSFLQIMSTTGETSHSQLVEGLQNTVNNETFNSYHKIKVNCRDVFGNLETDEVNFYVDILPPEIIFVNPTDYSTIETDSTEIEVTTNENATCYYKIEDSANCEPSEPCEESAFNQMSSTGAQAHSHLLENLRNTDYDLTIRCEDSANYQDEKMITFTVEAEEEEIEECVIPTDGMVITGKTPLCSGTYNLPNGISIGADNVVLNCNGAVLEGTSLENQGIFLDSKTNVTIKNCVITNYDKGIFLESSSNNTLKDNVINNNREGIKLHNSSRNILIDNIANYNERDGINLASFSTYNSITSNTANNNTERGINLNFDSAHNTVINNIANYNDKGIFILYASENELTNNTINNNTQGILLSFASNSILTTNRADYNENDGIYLNYINHAILDNNIANNNVNGIYLNNSNNGRCRIPN